MSVFSGNAFGRGVAFHSNDKISIAYRDEKGNISVKTKTSMLPKQRGILKRIPFIRGFIILLETFFRAWKMNIKLITIVLLSALALEYAASSMFAVEGLSDTITTAAEGYFLVVVLIAGFVFTRLTGISRYHGAEHKVFNASKYGRALTMESIKKEKRYAMECGTNLLVFVLVVFSIMQLLGVSFLVSFLVGNSIGYEIFIASNKKLLKLLKPFYMLGYIVQYYVFTSEPTEKELEVALAAYKGMS